MSDHQATETPETTQKPAHRSRRHRRRGGGGMTPCFKCGRMIGRRWAKCPYCGRSRAMERFGSLLMVLLVIGIPVVVTVLAIILARP